MRKVWERIRTVSEEADLLCIEDRGTLLWVNRYEGRSWHSSYLAQATPVEEVARSIGFIPSDLTVNQFDCLYNLFTQL